MSGHANLRKQASDHASPQTFVHIIGQYESEDETGSGNTAEKVRNAWEEEKPLSSMAGVLCTLLGQVGVIDVAMKMVLHAKAMSMR